MSVTIRNSAAGTNQGTVTPPAKIQITTAAMIARSAVAVWFNCDSAQTITAVSDDLSNAFTQRVVVIAASTRNELWTLDNLPSGSAGARTISASLSGANNHCTSAYAELASGVGGASVQWDAGVGNTQAGDGNPWGNDGITSTAATATGSAGIVLGMTTALSHGNNNQLHGTGFTSDLNVWGAYNFTLTEWKQYASAGSYAATFTSTDLTETYGTILGLFKEVAGSSNAAQRRRRIQQLLAA
jgi:hypothetical protein